jgi:Rad3-related DNA helicase
MGIDLTGAICVLDEAHNVEDTLRESGSGKFGEIEIAEIWKCFLRLQVQAKRNATLLIPKKVK